MLQLCNDIFRLRDVFFLLCSDVLTWSSNEGVPHHSTTDFHDRTGRFGLNIHNFGGLSKNVLKYFMCVFKTLLKTALLRRLWYSDYSGVSPYQEP